MLSIYHLPNQIPGEKIIAVIRRDLIILIKRIAFCLVLMILPWFLLVVLLNMYPGLLDGDVSYPFLILSVSSYYLFAWLLFFFFFIDYYLDLWIITDERIIDVQQHGFFSRIIAEQRLYRVQDVTSEVHGIIPTVFRYGDVYAQTAGTVQRFFFHQVPDPDHIRNTIIRLAELSKAKHQSEVALESGQKLAEALEHKL